MRQEEPELFSRIAQGAEKVISRSRNQSTSGSSLSQSKAKSLDRYERFADTLNKQNAGHGDHITWQRYRAGELGAPMLIVPALT